MDLWRWIIGLLLGIRITGLLLRLLDYCLDYWIKVLLRLLALRLDLRENLLSVLVSAVTDDIFINNYLLCSNGLTRRTIQDMFFVEW